MTIDKTPFQSFKLNLDTVADCIALISTGIDTRYAIAHEMGMGVKKVEGIFEWAEFLGVIEGRRRTKQQGLTPLGLALTNIPRFSENVPTLEILYAMISLNHPLVNNLVNGFMYDISRQFEPGFDRDQFKTALLNVGQRFNVNPTFLGKRSPIYLDLLSSLASFGRLNVVVGQQHGKSFRVNTHRPDWRSAAYILYDSWPENVSRVRINEVVGGQNSLGRIFFLAEPQVMTLLVKLEQERAIALEIVADLNQIGRNPSMKAQDFLEMLIHDQN